MNIVVRRKPSGEFGLKLLAEGGDTWLPTERIVVHQDAGETKPAATVVMRVPVETNDDA